jgi:hypothetical protein
MFDANPPTIYPSYSTNLFFVNGEDVSGKLLANSPIKVGVASGGQRPPNGQLYPRGDR